MPFKILSKRREYLKAWRKKNPASSNKYYRTNLLKNSSKARQAYYKRLWALKEDKSQNGSNKEGN